MVICNKGHEPISFEGGKSPLCRTLGRNEELKSKIEDLQFGLLISDEETILEFESFDEKRVCCPAGRA